MVVECIGSGGTGDGDDEACGDQGFRGCGFGGDDVDIVVVLEVGWWQ